MAALTRIGRTLESLIAQLHEARHAMTELAGRERHDAVARYRDVRAQALRYRWYLEVQREALGLRHHRTIDEFYAVPGPIET